MTKRKRGRPIGSGSYDDSGPFAHVARKMAVEGCDRGTAIAAVVASGQAKGASAEAIARRLRAKWASEGLPAYQAAMQRALESSRPHRNDVTPPSTPWPIPTAPAGTSVTSNWFSKETTQALAAAATFRPSPDLLRAVKIATSSLRDFEKNHRPIVEAMARLAENSKTIREAYPLVPPYSPALAASLAAIKVPQVPDSVIEQFRQISNSPTIIAMRELMKRS